MKPTADCDVSTPVVNAGSADMNPASARRYASHALVAGLFIGTLALTGMCGADESRSARSLTVYAVNYPLEYFAARIADERLSVVFPAPADVDPAFWRPSAETIIAYQEADLILLNGAGYARWRDLASLPRSRLVDTSARFRNEFIHAAAVPAHRHGPTGEHDHAGTAFTTWLDFGKAVLQARAVADALVRLDPDNESTFRSNFSALERDLTDLDRAIAEAVQSAPDRIWLASHPVYQYLARRHGVTLEAVTWEPDEYPVESEWRALEALVGPQRAQWMLWESEPLPETAERLAALGVQIIVFNPCANAPASEDFLAVMRDNVRNLVSSYE